MGGRLLDESEVMLEPPDDLPPEPNVWEVLTRPRTEPSEIRQLFKTSRYLGGACNPWGNLLSKYAKEFCEAKDPAIHGKRYPGSNGKTGLRRSSDDKRADYLARVLAGFSLQKQPPMSPETAERLLRDLHRKAKHSKDCPCWRCVIKRRPKVSAKLIENWRSKPGMRGEYLFRTESATRKKPTS